MRKYLSEREKQAIEYTQESVKHNNKGFNGQLIIELHKGRDHYRKVLIVGLNHSHTHSFLVKRINMDGLLSEYEVSSQQIKHIKTGSLIVFSSPNDNRWRVKSAEGFSPFIDESGDLPDLWRLGST